VLEEQANQRQQQSLAQRSCRTPKDAEAAAVPADNLVLVYVLLED